MNNPDPLAITDLPQGEEKARSVQLMFDRVAPRYDALNRVLTFGMDVRWRKRTARDLALPAGSRIVDLACGTGDFCRELAGQGLEPLGFDMSFGMLDNARTTAPLCQADALRLPLPDGAVDGATCGFALRNFVDVTDFFNELGRVTRPGGRIAVLEVSEPKHRLLRFGHSIYFNKVVPFIGGLFSDRAAYRYLPKSVSYLPPTNELLAIVERAGFSNVERHQLSTGISQLILATRGED